MKNHNIFIIVPVYNENEVLRCAVAGLHAKGYNICVVDDGSAVDQSNFLKGIPVHFIKHSVNLGQGAALETGKKYALQKGADFIVHFDADGQHSAADVELVLQPLFTGKADLVLGSRFLSKTTLNLSFEKKFILTAARYLNYFFSGILLTDAHNGLRAMTAAAARKIVIEENRMAHASEILFLAKTNGLSITEVPVTIHYPAYAVQKGQRMRHAPGVTVDIILHKLFQ
jgi:glycosyltransferase involved in cell wall biosynthesis